MTNLEKLRNRTVEELADFHVSYKCPPGSFGCMFDDGWSTCSDCWAKWLQQEAEE